MAELIKEELKCRAPREARDAVVRKVGLSTDVRVDDVIPMRAVGTLQVIKTCNDFGAMKTPSAVWKISNLAKS